MLSYKAPVDDVLFLLRDVFHIERYDNLPGFADANIETLAAILSEGGKFCEEVLQPLNRVGDREGCKRNADGSVTTPKGFKEAYKQMAEGGWIGLSAETEYGGQGLPHTVDAAMNEFASAANMAFNMYPGLSKGAYRALSIHGSDEQKQKYLPKLASGEWSGTMNLTEPHCGTDLGLIRTKAAPQQDGSYKITGTKIFISAGEHDLSKNIIHLVLARLPDAPPGVKGISLFVVPKSLLNADGTLGMHNDVRCIAIERKMGIHASPTCTMSYGERDGAVGFLVGEPNRGLEYMFIMMNDARFGVGVQGFALGETAYQHALAYAHERIQGRDAVNGQNNVPIIRHPDVKRMLLAMRARIMASRMLAYTVAGWYDRMHHDPNPAMATKCHRYVDLLMPVIKGWCAELGNEVADIAIQVFGGSGFVEETGVAQVRRDARIITIYEGTTGIQANDLVGRKVLREGAQTLQRLTAEMREIADDLLAAEDLRSQGRVLNADLDVLEQTTQWILANGQERLADVLAVAVPFLHLLGTICGSWQMGRAALAAREKLTQDNDAYYRGIVDLARFWFTHNAPQVSSLCRVIRDGGPALTGFDPRALDLQRL